MVEDTVEISTIAPVRFGDVSTAGLSEAQKNTSLMDLIVVTITLGSPAGSKPLERPSKFCCDLIVDSFRDVVCPGYEI